MKVQLLPPGFCLRCGHHESAHADDIAGGFCEVEVSDYGNLDCECEGLRLCAACEGDPEAHDLHVCPRQWLASAPEGSISGALSGGGSSSGEAGTGASAERLADAGGGQL